MGGGGKGGGGDTQTSVQKADPWIGVQPYITDYLKGAQDQYKKPFSFSQGDTIAPFSPEQELGLSFTTERAINGSPVMNAAQGNAYNTLTGGYMSPDSNPWLKDNVNTALDAVQGRINSQFNNNAYGSTAHQETLQRGLGQVASGMYGDNYNRERQFQQGAMQLSPTLAESDYRDAQALLGVGDARQQLAQKYMDAANGLFTNNNNWNQTQLDNYGRAVGTGMGAGSTTTTTAPNPNQSNGIADLIGTGLSIYGLGSQFGLFSDIRLKSNIRKIGKHAKGFGVYEYIKFGRREVGVIAQEVMDYMPEAVKQHQSGYLMVNYGAL